MQLLPSQRGLYLLIALLLSLVVIGGLDFFVSQLFLLRLVAIAMIVLVVMGLLIDMLSLRQVANTEQLFIERRLPRYLIVNEVASIQLRLVNRGEFALRLTVFDHVPLTFSLLQAHTTVMPATLTLKAQQVMMIAYDVKAQRRGPATFIGTQVRIFSRWQLWQRNQILNVVDEVKVYPDFRQIEQDDLLSDNQQKQGNLVHLRKRGTGTDFAQLREYRRGDTLSQIDHKATARFGKLISKEYQIERDQQVMILLDTSRRLRLFQSGLSHFDYALNTTIFLARSVLNQGDAVGMMSFGSEEIRYSAPKKGRHSVNQLLNAVYDLHTSRQAPDYVEAAKQLMSRQKRRSLVIIVTSLQEEDTEAIKVMLRILQKRHIVIIANLKPQILGEALTIRNLDQAIFYASRETYNHYREQMLQQISNQQLILLDTYPQSLTARLINLYLNIKQSGLF